MMDLPHSEDIRPACVACNPGQARVQVVGAVVAPTHHDPPPRQEGEAGALSSLRQVRDGAGVGGRAREQLNRGEAAAITIATNY